MSASTWAPFPVPRPALAQTAQAPAPVDGKPRPPFAASDWRPFERASLRGFFSLHLPLGLVLHGCSLHEQGDKRWIGLPVAPQLDQDGKHRVATATGKKAYKKIVEIPDRLQRTKFQREALAAIDRLLGSAPCAPG